MDNEHLLLFQEIPASRRLLQLALAPAPVMGATAFLTPVTPPPVLPPSLPPFGSPLGTEVSHLAQHSAIAC